MTRTLILAERAFRGLRSRAILAQLAARLGEPPPLIAVRSPGPIDGFEATELEPDPAALGISRVILAGAFHERPELERALNVARRAVDAGSTLAAMSLSLEGSAARHDPPAGHAVLDAATDIEARDHRSADVLLIWGVAPVPRIAPYPEMAIEHDPALAGSLPPGRLLGLAILGANAARHIERHGDRLRAIFAPMRGWPVVPLPSEWPGTPNDEFPATLDFARAILPGSPVLLPELAGEPWRRRQFTAPRLKALAARCAIVAGNQDMPAAFAVAAGVPVLGIALGADRRIASCLATLANDLPAGSDLIYPERYVASPRESSSARA
jgi:hypothetical protein